MASEDQLGAVRGAAKDAYDEGRFAATAELLGAYVRCKEDDAFAWMMLGDAQRVLGLTDEAERSLRRSLELDSGRWMTRVRLARLCDDAGRHDEAEAWYAEALEDPEAAATGYLWIFRGSNFARQCQLRAAEECHRKAAALDHVDVDEAYLNLGYVLRAQGRYVEAGAAFRRALELCPDYPEAAEGMQSLEGVEGAIAAARSLLDR
jgi:tetratricopeptide (TPR) repeat protein